MGQLNFRHFNTKSKKFFETVNVLQKLAKTKGQYYFGITSRSFRPFCGNVPKATEDCRRFLKTYEEVGPLPKMSEEPSNDLKVLSSETANIKNYGRITLNT